MVADDGFPLNRNDLGSLRISPLSLPKDLLDLVIGDDDHVMAVREHGMLLTAFGAELLDQREHVTMVFLIEHPF